MGATNRPWNIAFRSDGTIFMSTIGPAKSGSYRVDAGAVLLVHMDDGERFKAAISLPRPDQLVLTDDDGAFTTFQRVQ